MKLYECCDIGYGMGLETIGECLRNIRLHSTNLFDYDDICDELKELEEDFAASPFEERMSAVDVIGETRAAEIDHEIEDVIEKVVFDEQFFRDVDGGFTDDETPF